MFYQEVEEYCSQNGMNISSFEKMCGLGNGTVRLWKDDKNIPKLDTIQKMSKATGIPVNKWIEQFPEHCKFKKGWFYGEIRTIY